MLGEVGVLILIDEDKVEALLPMRCDLRIVLEYEPGVEQQVVEVHRVGLLQALFIAVVNLGHEGTMIKGVVLAVLSYGCIARRQDEPVLGCRDAILHGTRLIDLLVEVHLSNDKLDEAQAVGGVVDSVVLVVAQAMALNTQYLGKDAVKGAHPERRSFLGRYEGSDALAHLLRRLIGKGQRKDVPRLHTLLQKVRYLVGQDARLAATRSGYDERRSIDAKHRFALTGIEVFEIHAIIY